LRREVIHKLEREEGDLRRRIAHLEGKHPQVEKREDTVGSVTMINGTMSSTLMG
jgi:hypothetical protein